MLVGHASATRQYRYCRVAGCGESVQVGRVFRLKNSMCLRFLGAMSAAGRMILSADFLDP